MASNKTANLKLNQWLATDAVLRSDFNADNQKIDTALSAMPRMVFGTYRGTGTSGEANPRTLNFTFTPFLVIIVADKDTNVPPGTVLINGQEYSSGLGSHSEFLSDLGLKVTWGEQSVSWYCRSTENTNNNPVRQLNADGQLYHYFAIGLDI